MTTKSFLKLAERSEAKTRSEAGVPKRSKKEDFSQFISLFGLVEHFSIKFFMKIIKFFENFKNLIKKKLTDFHLSAISLKHLVLIN